MKHLINVTMQWSDISEYVNYFVLFTTSYYMILLATVIAVVITLHYVVKRYIYKRMFEISVKSEKSIYKEIVRLLIHSDKNPNYAQTCMNLLHNYPRIVNCSYPPYNYTPFLIACMRNSPELVSYMINKGANINMTNVNGDGAIYIASYAIVSHNIDSFAILNVLINAGCAINQAKQPSGYTALHVAANFGHSALIRWLLLHGADPNPPSKRSPYQIAKKLGHEDAAALLFINIGQDSTRKI